MEEVNQANTQIAKRTERVETHTKAQKRAYARLKVKIRNDHKKAIDQMQLPSIPKLNAEFLGEKRMGCSLFECIRDV